MNFLTINSEIANYMSNHKSQFHENFQKYMGGLVDLVIL